jgi:N4-gp56 family major capsid protein
VPDTYLSTSTTNFDKTVVALILKATQATLRGGLAYTPRGSVIGATLMPGTNGTFRSFGYSDLSEDGAVSIEDGQPDPDVEDLDLDYVEFTGTAKGRTVGVTDNSQARSPHNLATIAVEKVSRDIAVSVDNVPRALYAAATPDLFGGSATAVNQVTANDGITAGLIKDAVAILRDKDVAPLPNGMYALPLSPKVIRDLQADEEYQREVSYAHPEAFLTGQIASFAGAAIINAGSRAAKANDGSSSATVYRSVLIGADAVFAALGGLHVIPVTGPDKADPLNRRDLYSWKGFLGGILNDVQATRFAVIATGASLDA